MSDLELVQDDVAKHLDDIKSMFKPGSRIMIFVRQANDPEGRMDFVMGDDDLPQIIAMCSRRMGSKPHGARDE